MSTTESFPRLYEPGGDVQKTAPAEGKEFLIITDVVVRLTAQSATELHHKIIHCLQPESKQGYKVSPRPIWQKLQNIEVFKNLQQHELKYLAYRISSVLDRLGIFVRMEQGMHTYLDGMHDDYWRRVADVMVGDPTRMGKNLLPQDAQ